MRSPLKHLIITILVLSGSAHAATVTIGAAGSNYTAIQEAIDEASPGDTIVVHAGTYYENLDVDKQLTIRGEGNPIVDGRGEDSTITLRASGIVLEGLEVTNSSRYGAGISIPMSLISDSYGNVIRANNISNNGRGIALKYTGNNTLSGNAIYNNRDEGIDLVHCEGNRLMGNNIINNSDGITLSDASETFIEDNIILNNSGRGIYLGCFLTEAGPYGFSSNNTLRGNTVQGNGYGIYLDRAGNNTIYGNRLINNTVQDAYDHLSEGINYWDHGSKGNYYRDLPKRRSGSENGFLSSLTELIFGSRETKRAEYDDNSTLEYPIPGGSSVDRHPEIWRE